jgi:glycosyltransferase involved in cell wall biosynthesis
VLANKANYLVKRGYEVIIITTDQKNRMPFFALSSHIRCYDLEVNYAENNNKGFLNKILHYPWKHWKHKKRLTKLLKELQADIVISMFCNDVSFIAKIQDGSKKILEIHFSKFKRLQYGRKGIWKLADRLRSQMDEKTVKEFDKFIVLTHEDKSYWGDLANMEVIENAKNEWGDHTAALENKQVIAVGRYDFQKGFDMLIEAWRLVYDRFPDWKLKIIGDGEMRNELEILVDKYRLGTFIELKKSISDILPEYLEASILVMSSRYEGFGLVLIEAMSVGLPVIAFACKCGPKDIITHEKDGLLVPEGDIKALADKIIWMMANEKKRQEMGIHALEKASLYSQEKIMAKWENLFLLLTNQKNR